MMTTEKITVYTPESPLRHPVRLFFSMWRDLLACRGLAWRLFVRDTSSAYRSSFLGYLWAFIPPVVTTVSFTYLNSQGVISVTDTGVPYPCYVMIGMLFWQTFIDALNCPQKAVNGGRSMLSKINFPREALLVAGIGEILFNLLIRMLLLIPLFWWFKLPVSVSILLVPVGVFSLILLGMALGLILLPAMMMFHDLARGIGMATNFWMLLTPVVYPPPKGSLGALLTQWNPVSPVLTTCREWLLGNAPTLLPEYFLVMALSLVVFLIGWLLYRLTMPLIIERMGS
jgi:lipopolysaccharide transport system permease protein